MPLRQHFLALMQYGKRKDMRVHAHLTAFPLSYQKLLCTTQHVPLAIIIKGKGEVKMNDT